MDTRLLHYFVAVAEAGTITRAAERCRIAQPSLTQQLKRLETTLGVQLLDRLGRGVALTDAGRALLPRARRILAEVRDAEVHLQSDVESGVGRLTIGAIPTMAPYLLPDPLTRLRDEYPACELTVRENLTEHLIELLIDNEIDVALVSTPIEHELMEVEVIGQEPLLVVVPTEHPLREAGAITLPELRNQPTITLHEMHCLGQQIAGFCAARRLAKNVVCRSTQLATVLEFVRLGLGVSLVPAMAAAQDTSAERAYLRLKRGTPHRDIALAWRAGRTRPLVAQRLAEHLTEQVQVLTS